MKAEIASTVNKNRSELYKVLPLETPYSMFIDVCNACNFKCKFCAIQYADRKLPFKKMCMDYDLFCKIVEDLKRFPYPLRMLRLNGNGEPLINKRLPEMIRHVKNAGVTEWAEFITNGSLLESELNRKIIDSGIDRIRISIEGIGSEEYFAMSGAKIDWNRFVNNIKDLYENRKNCEIYIKTVDVAVDTEEKRNTFFSIFGDICDKIFIEHVYPAWTNYEEINEDFGGKLENGLYGGELKNVEVCPFPFYTCMINSDGEVTACCHDWERKIVMGNVKTESLYDIWNGEKYFQFLKGMLEKGRKKNHPAACANCSVPCFNIADDLDSYREIVLDKYK